MLYSCRYTFTNRHTKPKPKVATHAEAGKVYVVLVQTDGLGLGAWARPGRGNVTYAWEVTLPDLELQPALLQMFYENATERDYFVGALSGPGYMYPKAVPPALLPKRLAFAQEMMTTLDLAHWIIFDASATHGEHTCTGDTTLSEAAVAAYFASDTMPATKGFLNGYAPAFTNARDAASGRSLLSFEYYLDPSRTVEAAVQDLTDLAAANLERPYFLPVHVREFSAITKVSEILNALPEGVFEVVAIDTFFDLVDSSSQL